MSISRKVRPIRKFEASAATFLASLARRCVAMTPARPRFRPRHIRFVIAPSDSLRASSETSPLTAGAKSCASSTTSKPSPAVKEKITPKSSDNDDDGDGLDDHGDEAENASTSGTTPSVPTGNLSNLFD